MPIFEYKGLDKQGRTARGVIDAENLRAARMRLKKDGVFVSEIKDKTKTIKRVKPSSVMSSGNVNVKDLSNMTRQLATLLKANVPLVETLAAVSEQTENPVLSEAMADIKNMVNEGSTLFKGLNKYPKIFDKIYVSMCEAGETSGTLDVILMRLAEFTENRHALASKVKSAMIYPVIMFVATSAILMFLFVYVVPKLLDVYAVNPDLTLPWYTQVVFGISGFMVDYWYVIIAGAVVAFLSFVAWKNTKAGSDQWDQIVLVVPMFGRMTRTLAVSRFSRTLSTLLAGGVPMLNAMAIVRNVVDNEVIARAIDDARENISEGESIAGPLKRSGQFPPLVLHMISIGEKTGDLENMLNQVSNSYDYQVKVEVEGLAASLEPTMLVVMGGLIFGIVLSIMAPIMDLMGSS
jgi:general secretion pathway protein F